MTLLRRIELICGITTGLLALAVSCTLFRPRLALDVLGILPLYLTPAMTVALGSYLHVVRRRRIGWVMLMLGGLILTAIMSVLALGGLFYLYGLWGGILILGPSATSIMTMLTSLFVQSRND